MFRRSKTQYQNPRPRRRWFSGCPWSASLNRRSENVIVEAIVIPKLELCNVKWQVFGANLVERTDEARARRSHFYLERIRRAHPTNLRALPVICQRSVA